MDQNCFTNKDNETIVFINMLVTPMILYALQAKCRGIFVTITPNKLELVRKFGGEVVLSHNPYTQGFRLEVRMR